MTVESLIKQLQVIADLRDKEKITIEEMLYSVKLILKEYLDLA